MCKEGKKHGCIPTDMHYSFHQRCSPFLYNMQVLILFLYPLSFLISKRRMWRQIPIGSLDRVYDETGNTGMESVHTIYLGSGLRRVIPYVLLCLVIHDEGIPRAEDYNDV